MTARRVRRLPVWRWRAQEAALRHPRVLTVWDCLFWWAQHRALELWRRHDVGGHAIGCRMVPSLGQDDGSVTCDCYASVWRQVRR